ncbi:MULTISPECIES: glycosyltransferase family 2 protein [Nocardiaceae]|uniref:glycosyltransferase family 2 protein n=1 Tax=Nocardiaceae TaxID=85025 RepID=UPI001F44B860|nr:MULTISPECIES: glycosyltransferase family 2 protein [Rhodococcus]
MVLLSVVVPCHNEESVLDALVDAVLSIEPNLPVDPDGRATVLELVLVDDGSRDGTKAVMRDRNERDERVRYVSFSRNFGKESAMLAGLSYARGDAVVIMDADLQHPPHLIEDMVRLHREGYDQVVARRTRDGDSRGRTALSRMYYRVVNRVVDVSIEDGAGDFRLLSRRAVDALLQMGEYNRFSKGLFSWIGFPVATVDYRNEPRQGGGESKWTLRRLLNYGLDGVMSFNNAPLRLAIYLGAAAMIVGFAYVVFLIAAAVVAGVTVPGYVTLVAAIIGFGGLQLLFLGVIGEYVGRIYYEVKQRPHYLVAETEPGMPAGSRADRRVERSSDGSTGRFRPSHAVPAVESTPNGPARRAPRRDEDA